MGDDILGMSDEDFMNASFDTPVEDSATAESASDSGADDFSEETTVYEEGTDESHDDFESEAEAEADEADGEHEAADESGELEESPAGETDPDESGDEASEPDSADSVDYKSEYERLLAPFKANGRDMQVSNVDEAITLMQQGANYNKKMTALKPNLKLMRMLDNHSLLDEGKLSYLIDLDKKNPDAIKKLIKDSGIDTYELDGEDTDYKPNTYTVDDAEMELASVLDEIKGTDAYEKTVQVVSNKWDTASRQAILNNPQTLAVINEHVASGIYDQITAEIERERMFGRLSGLSDIEAYRQVGDRLHAAGKFRKPDAAQNPPRSNERPTPTPNKKPAEEVRKQKQRVSTPRSSKGASPEPTFNPLAMSDDEFLKQFSEMA
ncbi:hypothetical protein [Alteromonas sp. RKMC-009]|uniref:hypothetical protein n=1 Tax=Alteromonas sp. RKMC-009 TaxID=2267264 RepID=UPI000E6A8AE9|nr:hypothetical protein [Alteromonas sp. RKMC-009]AYA64328.1 hypothetical protein DS731_10140 [Alteromonas sp. RKMC-009]